MLEHTLRPAGKLQTRLLRAAGPGWKWTLSNTLRFSYLRGLAAYHLAPLLGKLIGFTVVTSRLIVRVRRAATGEWINYGAVCYRQVTTVGCNAMSTSFQTPASPGNFWYHAIGTGAGAEGAGNTTLTTECTTAYNPDSTRPAGTHVAGGSANIYRTVGTVTVDIAGPTAVTEHGVFDAASAGNLLDRHTFAAVNLSLGDSFQATYEITFTAGG